MLLKEQSTKRKNLVWRWKNNSKNKDGKFKKCLQEWKKVKNKNNNKISLLKYQDS